jgi:catechol 2,3-dioxygenase-like lactoylglutathione lyase family enzyme
MLGEKNVLATLAVKDVKTAAKFYEGTLGLKLARSVEASALVYTTGSSQLLVYQSSFAGTNKATAATFSVGDQLETIIKALKSKGVSFEHYDFPGIVREGDVHVSGKIRNAWFKDPDGNILNLVNG